MRTVVILLVAGLASSLAHPVSIAAQQSDYLIVPGQRVGGWTLGSPPETFGLGQPRFQYQVTDRDIPWVEGRLFFPGPDYHLQIETCRNDTRSIGIYVARLNHYPPGDDAAKFRTPEGARIGMSVNDVVRLLGQPPRRYEWKERHAQTEVVVDSYGYQGLDVRINRADGKAFAIGARNNQAYDTCWLGTFGGRAAARRQDLTSPGPSSVPLPRNLRVISPIGDISAKYAAISGTWIGWDKYNTATVLVVEQILLNPDRAIVVVAWGGRAPIWMRSAGRFTSEGLIINWSSRLFHRYRLVGQDRLEAQLEDLLEPEHSHYFMMSRVTN